MIVRLVRSIGIAAALAAAVGHADAAEIRRDLSKDLQAILVTGRLDYGDERKFADVALGLDNAVVILNGPGGNLHAGLEIGRAIRVKGFSTAVPVECASACALAWLGGRKRLVLSGGRVGFHAASVGNETTAGGNALVGAYLGQMGFASGAILMMTSASPGSMEWLTPGMANAAGIDVVWGQASRTVRPVRAEASSPLRPVASLPGGANGWTAYGEWVQVGSRRRYDEALALARTVMERNANTNVFLYDNGWYAVTVGPFSQGRGQVALDALVAAGEVPRDSLVTQGGRFVSLEWGTPPRSKGALGVSARAR